MKKMIVSAFAALAAAAALASAPAPANADIPVYRAHPVTPAPAARPVHVYTRGDFAVMNARINRQAARAARQWNARHPGRPLTPAQLQAIRTESCLVMAAGNPDVRCVPGR